MAPGLFRRLVPGAVIVALCVGSVLLARKSRSAAILGDQGLRERTRGSASAPLLVTEFSDFQCPNCRTAAPMLERLLSDYDGKIRLTFRHYPLRMHRWSREAAAAGECAALQGKFWPYHDMLFGRQDEWGPLDDPQPRFSAYAREAGLDVPKFEACERDPETAKRVQSDVDEGDAWQVDGTPTVFIGRSRLVGAKQIYLNAAQTIEKELRR